MIEMTENKMKYAIDFKGGTVNVLLTCEVTPFQYENRDDDLIICETRDYEAAQRLFSVSNELNQAILSVLASWNENAE